MYHLAETSTIAWSVRHLRTDRSRDAHRGSVCMYVLGEGERGSCERKVRLDQYPLTVKCNVKNRSMWDKMTGCEC